MRVIGFLLLLFLALVGVLLCEVPMEAPVFVSVADEFVEPVDLIALQCATRCDGECSHVLNASDVAARFSVAIDRAIMYEIRQASADVSRDGCVNDRTVRHEAGDRRTNPGRVPRSGRFAGACS